MVYQNFKIFNIDESDKSSIHLICLDVIIFDSGGSLKQTIRKTREHIR